MYTNIFTSCTLIYGFVFVITQPNYLSQSIGHVGLHTPMQVAICTYPTTNQPLHLFISLSLSTTLVLFIDFISIPGVIMVWD